MDSVRYLIHKRSPHTGEFKYVCRNVEQETLENTAAYLYRMILDRIAEGLVDIIIAVKLYNIKLALEIMEVIVVDSESILKTHMNNSKLFILVQNMLHNTLKEL